MQQQREALEELGRTIVSLARLRKLIREQNSYEPAALEESATALIQELGYTAPRFTARLSILVALRCGRVEGLQSESE
jgi:hypothetical protein